MSLATLKKTRGIICGTHGPTGTLLHHEEGKAMDGNHIDERSDGAGGSSPTREERERAIDADSRVRRDGGRSGSSRAAADEVSRDARGPASKVYREDSGDGEADARDRRVPLSPPLVERASDAYESDFDDEDDDDDDDDDDEDEDDGGDDVEGGMLGRSTRLSIQPNAHLETDDGLCDPPSPHVGRFGNRIKSLRHRIVKGLGENLFDEAYAFLKDKLVRPADDGATGSEEDYEFDFAQMQQAMVRILGKDKIHFWDMIDELILVEEAHDPL